MKQETKLAFGTIAEIASDLIRRSAAAAVRFYRRNTKAVNKVALVAAIAITFIVSLNVVSNSARERTIEEMETEFSARLDQERARIEEELKAEYGFDLIDQQKDAIELEAETIAKLLYPMQYNTDKGLRSACWCVFNRADSEGYPGSVESVCTQKDQWMGWSEDNPVIDRLYRIAKQELEVWHKETRRPMSTEYVFLEWNSKSITLRTKFEGGYGNHVWYEDDWDEWDAGNK